MLRPALHLCPLAASWWAREGPHTLIHRPPTPAELLRENKRMLDRAIRELDRERMGLQTQEKKLILEIKKMAKEGQMVRWGANLLPPLPKRRHAPPPAPATAPLPALACPCP